MATMEHVAAWQLMIDEHATQVEYAIEDAGYHAAGSEMHRPDASAAEMMAEIARKHARECAHAALELHPDLREVSHAG